jgi:GH24 family phage-related lysozyme (muramidase)
MTAITIAQQLIKHYEGLHLRAYPDPLSGGEPWTIGWGATRWFAGRPVLPWQTCTEEEAEQFLNRDTFPVMFKLKQTIPYWGEMSANQQAALIDFAFNLGANFYASEGFDSISSDLRNKRWSLVPKTLLYYRNPGSSVELGLLRRRYAEGLVWCGNDPDKAICTAENVITELEDINWLTWYNLNQPQPPTMTTLSPAEFENFFKFYKGEPHQRAAVNELYAGILQEDPSLLLESAQWVQTYRTLSTPAPTPPAPSPNPLTHVPYFWQYDNPSGENNECWATSIAMLVASLGKIETEDEYHAVWPKFGQSTAPATHINACARLGLVASYSQAGTFADIQREIDDGYGVAVGWVHRGHVTNPGGGGHWSVLFGYTDHSVIGHCPHGDIDLITGTDISTAKGAGKNIEYSFRNWRETRWFWRGTPGWLMTVREA